MRPPKTGRNIRTASKRRSFAILAGNIPITKKLSEFSRFLVEFTLRPSSLGPTVNKMEEIEAPWFCYMLECRDGFLDVGIASDVQARLKRHNWGVGPGLTEKRRPVPLIWE